MLKDTFGREIKVGDAIAFSSGSSVGVETAIVIKLNPKTVSTNRKLHTPRDVMIVNDQFIYSGQEARLEAMIKEVEKNFDHSKPVVRVANPTYRYAAVFVGDNNTQKMFVYVARLPHGNGASGPGWGEIEKELRRLGGIFRKTAPYGNNRYTSLKFRNGAWTIPEGYYGPEQEILLRELTALGLDQYCNQRIEMDLFETIVAGKLPAGLKLPDFFK